MGLGIKPTTSHMQDRCFAAEYYPYSPTPKIFLIWVLGPHLAVIRDYAQLCVWESFSKFLYPNT